MARRPSPARRTAAATRAGWSVYLLRCGDGSLYAGCTNDLARRLAVHASGRGARYTRSRLPVALAWSEPAKDRSAALRREAAIKRLDRAAKQALVATRAPARTSRTLRTSDLGRKAAARSKPVKNRSLAHT